MSQLQLFARLAKVDVAKRQVTGVIASETPDAANEVFDYDTSKPLFEKWSGNVAKLSGGKSVGNVRAMHGNIAAGTLSDITFDDVAKTISVTADIVDDNEWNKVLKGVYTGFSIGGKYVKKWADTANKVLKRYTANPTEVSIVDIGCNPDATFTLCKADGMNVEVKFEDTEQGILSKLADETITGDERVELVKKLAGVHGVELAKADAGGEGEEEELAKGAYSIGDLARLAESVSNFCRYDAVCYNIDGTTTSRSFTPEIKAAATALWDGLLKLVAEDVEAAKAKLKELKKIADDEEGEPLRKSLEVAASEHETLGEVCKALGIEEGTQLADVVDTLNKALTAHNDLQKAHDEQTAKLNEVTEELTKLKAEPAPAKGVKTVVVDKGQDGKSVTKIDAPEIDEKDPLAMMKRAQSSGKRIAPGDTLAKHQ